MNQRRTSFAILTYAIGSLKVLEHAISHG